MQSDVRIQYHQLTGNSAAGEDQSTRGSVHAFELSILASDSGKIMIGDAGEEARVLIRDLLPIEH